MWALFTKPLAAEFGLGAALTGLSWVRASHATSLLSLTSAKAPSAGSAPASSTWGVVGLVMGWFPERRDLAAGLVAAGYGLGAILTTFPVADRLAASGYRAAPFALCLLFGVTGATVLGLAALPPALTVGRFCNGLTRPLFGALCDRIGRENTMFVAFPLEAPAMTAWRLTRGDPVLFVPLSGVVFFGWGEIFSLFPSTLTDAFGARNATADYGCLYMAQGVGSVLGGPIASLLHDGTGSWSAVFGIAVGPDVLAAVLALPALKPLRRRPLAAGEAPSRP